MAKKRDIGHEETEKIIAELEKRVAREYAQASAEVHEKLKDYLRRFVIKDEKWRLWVANGTKTEAEYKKWREGQIMMGKRWEDMRDALSMDYHNANVIARSIVDGYRPEAYAINHNWATYQIEHDARVDTSYTLYGRESVERIFEDDPDLLPPPGKRMKDRIAAGKDIAWQAGQIQSVTLQSILQGESIPNMAKRIAQTMGEKNHASTIRYARTAMTGAQNAGRVDAFTRAQSMGIELEQQWVATLDNCTRHSHRAIDGETVEVGGMFSNGCRYPGDPDGPPDQIWNCRCTLVSSIKGFARDFSDLSIRWSKNIGDMTYEEWKEAKSIYEPITKQEEISKAMKRRYINEYRRRRWGRHGRYYSTANRQFRPCKSRKR